MNENQKRLIVTGVNYRSTTVSEREAFQINKNDLSNALSTLCKINEVEGAVIVSTCNRLEFYMVLNDSTEPFKIIQRFYKEYSDSNPAVIGDKFYTHSEIDAANHLYRLLCGLDSMVFGEYQIQGQIKDAYSISCSEKRAEKILHKLFHAGFRTGKTVRSKTNIGAGKQSVSGIAFEIINDKIDKDKLLTIIGVNESTKIIAGKLHKSGFSKIQFVNRTLYKAEEVAAKYGAKALSLDQFVNSEDSSGFLLTCTGADGKILSAAQLDKIYKVSGLPDMIIDMAVPRDIDSEGLKEDTVIYDMESLKQYLVDQQLENQKDIPAAEKIIDDEVKLFEVWSESQRDESLAVFAEKIEFVRQQLLEESRWQFAEDEYQLLEKFSRSLVHRTKAVFNQSVKSNGNKKENVEG
jgi:glutamyl-tRNA reductase